MMITPSNEARLSRHERGAAQPQQRVKREPPGLLASPWFWGGGLMSLGIWALVIWAICKLF